MELFDFLDLTNQGKKLRCAYHGKHEIYLEGRILAEENDALTVGVSLWEEDVASHHYDALRASLDVFYQPPPARTIRIALLPMTQFSVPKDICEINVYDAEKKKIAQKRK